MTDTNTNALYTGLTVGQAVAVKTIAAMSVEQAQAIADGFRAENAKPKPPKPLRFGIGAKGALSVYGLQRFPVTLYRAQWERLLAHAPEITAYMEAHADTLTSKTAEKAQAQSEAGPEVS